MSMTVVTYVSYLIVAVPLTIWVARTLSSNGRVFLADVFDGNDALAEAVNRLLVVGFYLLNIGFVTLYLRVSNEVLDLRGVLETLSVKIGIVMLVLGLVHFFNVYLFNSIRRRSRMEAFRSAPVPHQGYAFPTAPTPQPQA
ncbi:MAG: hypothetical protein WBQ50_17090 [Nocardioides sp.]